MYLKGVETSVATAIIHEKNVADGTYEIVSGDICLGTVEVVSEKRTCNGETLEVEMNGEKPESGSITIADGKITDLAFTYSNGKTIVKNDGKLVYGEKEETEEVKTFGDICTYVSGTEKTAGAKYSCEVKEGTSYNFYVLTTPEEGSETINLIMDQNINSDGTPAGMTGVTQETNASQYNLVAWNNESGQSTNAYGPVTAMTFLYNATKDWTNIDPINYTYNDKTTQGTTAENTSYTSFVSSNGIATITPLTGDGVTIGSEATPVRARMPIYASDTTITEVADKTDANAYLYDNLDSSGSAAPYGYWTLSSNAGGSNYAWNVDWGGSVFSYDVYYDFDYGVRPVINLKL